MVTLKHHLPAFIFVGFIAVSLLVGWSIPAFYAWTESDQSRPSPLLWQVPLLSAIAATLFCAVLPWLPIASGDANAEPSDELNAAKRFSLRALLLVMTGFAVTMALLVKFPLVGGGIVTAGMVAYLIRFLWRYPRHRLATSALAACMILPFAWVIGYKELARILPAVIVLIGAFPTFFPSMWISRLADVHFRDSPGTAFLLTALELAAGLWLIRLGPKRTIAYLLLVIFVSALGSLVFYQLVRA